MDTVLTLDHVSKIYHNGRGARNITFSVERGQVVGLLGPNGAGKSTLLKLLSRVTAPTSGTICYNGRIASMLEVGTGFHPELTGRENVYLNGAQTADCDIGSVTVPAPVTFAVTENGLTTNLYDFLPAVDTKCVCSDVLGSAFEPEQRYEAPDGSPLTLDTDMCGQKHVPSPLPGPFAAPISELHF